MSTTLEHQLFDWKEWDGDHDCMIYYNPVLKVQVGKHPPGTKFDSAAILFDKGLLQLSNFDPDSGEPTYHSEYSLELKVKEVLKE